MKPTNLHFPILIAVLLVSCSLKVRAQLSPKQLSERSRMMFVDGNGEFLAIEMIKDGILEPGKPYEINYGKSGIFLNGQKVSDTLTSRYCSMLLRFEGKTAFSGDGRMIGTTHHDEFSQPYKIKDFIWQQPLNDNYRQLIDMLADDGLVPQSGNVAIYIQGEEVTVNGHKLTSPLELIYKARIIALSGYRKMEPGETFGILLKH